MTYSNDFKKLVIDCYYSNKYSIKQLLELFKISNGTLFNWINGQLGNSRKRKSKFTELLKEYIKKYVMARINFNYRLLLNRLKLIFKITISKSSIYNILKSIGITKKKLYKRYIPKQLTHKYNKLKNDLKESLNKINKKIISIDECSVDTHINNNFGWGSKGKRINIIKRQPKIRYTLICAISETKIEHYKIIKSSANSIVFTEFINELTSNINDEPLNILLDNARIHHSRYLKEHINNNINFIYNVPYTPEYNPIEQMFSKLKFLLRKSNITNQNVIKKIKLSLKKITTNNLIGYFRNSFRF
jgi:transposase